MEFRNLINFMFNKVHVFIVIATPLILSFDLHSAPSNLHPAPSNLNLQGLLCTLQPEPARFTLHPPT